jgi:RNase H-like domain found in reverse transcriptase
MWSKNIKLFTRLTKKNKLWRWQEEQRTLFKELKELFIAEPILKIYTLSLPTVVKTDVLDFILGVYLVQKHPDRWYLVIYYSCKMTPPELNYNIYNKELLNIVAVLKK